MKLTPIQEAALRNVFKFGKWEFADPVNSSRFFMTRDPPAPPPAPNEPIHRARSLWVRAESSFGVEPDSEYLHVPTPELPLGPLSLVLPDMQALEREGWAVHCSSGGRGSNVQHHYALGPHARESLAGVLAMVAGIYASRAELAQFSDAQRADASVWCDAKIEGVVPPELERRVRFLALLNEPAIYARTRVGVDAAGLVGPFLGSSRRFSIDIGFARTSAFAGQECVVEVTDVHTFDRLIRILQGASPSAVPRNFDRPVTRMRVAPISALEGPGPKPESDRRAYVAAPRRNYSGEELYESVRRERNHTGSTTFAVHRELPWIVMSDQREGPDYLECRVCNRQYLYDPQTRREALLQLQNFVDDHVRCAPALRAGDPVEIGADGFVRPARGRSAAGSIAATWGGLDDAAFDGRVMMIPTGTSMRDLLRPSPQDGPHADMADAIAYALGVAAPPALVEAALQEEAEQVRARAEDSLLNAQPATGDEGEDE